MYALPFSSDADVDVAVSFNNAQHEPRLHLQTSSDNSTVYGMVYGYYRYNRRETPLHRGRPYPIVPAQTVVCRIARWLELTVFRPATPKYLTHIFYINVDRRSFANQVRASLAQPQNVHLDMPDVMQGRVGVLLDGGVELGEANGPSPEADHVTLDIMLVSEDDGVETPIVLFQDMPEVYETIVAPRPAANPLRGHPITTRVMPAPNRRRHNNNRRQFRTYRARHRRFYEDLYDRHGIQHIYPREYTNPTRVGNPMGGDTYEPRNEDTCVVGCREFMPGSDIEQYQNWSSPNVWHYSCRRLNGPITTVRSVSQVSAIIIHETGRDNTPPDNPSWTGCEDADDDSVTAAHLLVSRDGTVSQFADLLEYVSHTTNYNFNSIGIENANAPYGRDQDPPDGEEVNAPWWKGPRPQRHLWIPPDECLRSLWALVEWLTGPRSPVDVPRVFPQLDPRHWTHHERNSLPVSRLQAYENKWSNELNLPYADGSVRGERYWQVHLDFPYPPQERLRRKIRNHRTIDPGMPGIYAHANISTHKGDGIFLALYLWRRAQGENHVDAVASATEVIQSDDVQELTDADYNRGAVYIRLPRRIARTLPPFLP